LQVAQWSFIVLALAHVAHFDAVPVLHVNEEQAVPLKEKPLLQDSQWSKAVRSFWALHVLHVAPFAAVLQVYAAQLDPLMEFTK